MGKERIDLKKFIRDVPDWPRKGILFRDITPLLGNADAFRAAIEAMAAGYVGAGVQYVVGVEARGFILGAAVAAKLNVGFIPVRKKGKLPSKTVSVAYDLEYGTSTVEIHKDAIPAGAKILMVDDLLATGGTIKASCELIEQLGGKIEGVVFLIELTELEGIKKLAGYKVKSIIRY
ncbi:MAG: adenine phosphoribosyltransferase [Sedimentisphaerales bacterium]|jgi:adenine phosphoribosyltransferase